jgi:hypothetical protein
MDKNESSHSHNYDPESVSTRPSTLWTILAGVGLVLVFGLLWMGYSLVKDSQDLTSFQTFVTTVLTAIVGLISGLVVKISYDRNKAAKEKRADLERQEIARRESEERQEAARREFEERQSAAMMKHEETLETLRLQNEVIRKQTNGRLHKRDEQIESLRELTDILIKENRMMKDFIKGSEVLVEAVSTIKGDQTNTYLMASNDSITELSVEIKQRDEELKDLKPFYNKEDQ